MYIDTSGGSRRCNETEKKSFLTALNTAVVNLIQANHNIQTDNQSHAFYNAYTWLTDGDTLVAPDPVQSNSVGKIGTPHDNFQKRKAAGEIMVSDYERWDLHVVQYPGYYSSSHVRELEAALLFQSLIDGGFMAVRPKGGVSMGPFWLSLPPDFTAAFYKRTYSEGNITWVFDDPLSASQVLASCRSQSPDFTAMITNVLAKANRSSVDVLTAFAEMPKAIESLIRGFRLVAKILMDVKRRNFSLSQGYERRKAIMNKQYLARMKRLDRELSNPKLSDLRRRALQKHKDRVTVGHREALLKSADELASSLADVWLNYRYNIMPNVYLVQDVLDAIDKFGREFITARSTKNSSLSLPSSSYRISASMAQKVMIKRSFSKPNAQLARSVMSNSLTVTAWELIPLSFVYDWFINVGDVLASQSYAPRWEQEGATKSTKLTLDAIVSSSPPHRYLVSPKTHVYGTHYKRDKINPQDCVGLVWQPTLGLERILDALALSWRPVRSLLIQGRNRR